MDFGSLNPIKVRETGIPALIRSFKNFKIKGNNFYDEYDEEEY